MSQLFLVVTCESEHMQPWCAFFLSGLTFITRVPRVVNSLLRHSHRLWLRCVKRFCMKMAERSKRTKQEFEVNLEQEKQGDGSEKDSLHAIAVMDSLWRIYREQKLCDVSLVVGGKEIEAHRLVLAANSNYFYTMFTGGLAESTAKKVVLNEVDSHAVELLVNYSYSSKIYVDNTNVEGLLRTSHLLQFNNIVKCCCDFMQSQLHPTNCLGVGSIAQLNGCTELQDVAMNFAKKHFNKVGKTNEFFMAPLPQIIELLCSDTLNVPCEKDVFDIALSWVKYDLTNREQYFPQILQNIRLPLISPKVLGK